MRLMERTRTRVELMPRACESGALGGRAERFSQMRTAVMATVLPEAGERDVQERGEVDRARLRLLLPANAAVAAGDGVQIAAHAYRVRSVRRWTAHLELDCEEIL